MKAILLLLTLLCGLYAVDSDSTATASDVVADTTTTVESEQFSDEKAEESSSLYDTSKVVTDPSIASANKDLTREGRIKVIKRDFNYRKQLGGALGMMLFFGIILSSTGSFNPR